VQLARQEGHVVLALVYDQALSGGFLSTGLMADACYALPAASIKVMDLGAMARITKIPLERLQSLAHSNPVFAPGPENFERMGAITAIWHDDLATHLSTALQNTIQQAMQRTDLRSLMGQERAGRNMAQQVIAAVLAEQRC
jgi:malonate decarboxylase gamma subunit